MYETDKMGAIPLFFTVFRVLGTALGPSLVGFLLDLNISFEAIMLIIFTGMVVVTLNSQGLKT